MKDYKFTLLDEMTYGLLLMENDYKNITTKEEFIYGLNKRKNKFNEDEIDKLIKKVKESTDEEFEEFKNRCLQ